MAEKYHLTKLTERCKESNDAENCTGQPTVKSYETDLLLMNTASQHTKLQIYYIYDIILMLIYVRRSCKVMLILWHTLLFLLFFINNNI